MLVLDIHPLTPQRWDDLVQLFGERGAFGGCWCMWWRQTAAEFDRSAGPGNRAALQGIVEEGRVPGLLGYVDDQPVGWCSVAPRQEFGRLQRSPILKPVDDHPVWAIVCFFVHRRQRRRGVASELLQGAVDHARRQGARIVEGYPVETGPKRAAAASLYTGTVSLFREAGFHEVARRSDSRPIMRLALEAGGT
ncbi:MAG: GNAT family N-acetyltransferase [Actinomycetota bacterium]|nr:GNAT family N-acetyltransferase [Actinomycetota bacterium]